MAFTVTPLPGNFGVEITDIDISSPDFSDEALRELLYTLYENQIVVLRDQNVPTKAFVSFSKRVGDPIPHVLTHRRLPGHPEIYSLTNITEDGKPSKTGAAHWHTDQSYDTEPSSITMLHAIQIPEKGGETRFCNLKRAYEELPPETKREIDNFEVEHLYGKGIAARPNDTIPSPLVTQEQVEAVPTVYHPLVRRHPITDQKTLYSIAGTSRGIKGMSIEDTKKILWKLGDHAFQDRFITEHHYRVHDLLMWDNPSTVHSATQMPAATGPHNTRIIHRISVRGTPSVFKE